MSFQLYDRNECEVEIKNFDKNKNDENLFYDDFNQNYMYVSFVFCIYFDIYAAIQCEITYNIMSRCIIFLLLHKTNW